MSTNTVSGTYGGNQTPCEVFTYETRYGLWYAVEGSANVNLCDEAEFSAKAGEGRVDVETLTDYDCMTVTLGIHSEEDLKNAVES